MNQLEQLISACTFFSGILGERTEIVIHDMETGEILWIAHGEITGRKAGKADQLSAIRLMAQRAKEAAVPGQLIGYRSAGPEGMSLRSSNLFLPDESGEYRYSVCVNQDVSGLLMLEDWLTSILHAQEKPASPAAPEATVDALIMDILYAELERAKPFSLDSREAKLRILKRLDEKGVFEVRHAGPKVCELLQIAQPTLYKYLKEIRGE